MQSLSALDGVYRVGHTACFIVSLTTSEKHFMNGHETFHSIADFNCYEIRFGKNLNKMISFSIQFSIFLCQCQCCFHVEAVWIVVCSCTMYIQGGWWTIWNLHMNYSADADKIAIIPTPRENAVNKKIENRFVKSKYTCDMTLSHFSYTLRYKHTQNRKHLHHQPFHYKGRNMTIKCSVQCSTDRP